MNTLYKIASIIAVIQLAGCGTYASMQKYATLNADKIVMGGVRTDIAEASCARSDPWLKNKTCITLTSICRLARWRI